ncbi:DDE-type integrase/transposase/recombinase [Microbulbifer hydrolyticus]|uniref:DDE-type integrase/transposase/recombinase n=1 Tax=Microbulbifer hydrolyticus TaxID=48074 RepID=A0ABX6J4R5_9GAMM|nr:DDE-type integrase/transposase/recombinase [Microbulbifer hydrolyticus]
MDAYGRRIVGWAVSSTPGAGFTVKPLKMAWEQRGGPHSVMLHSDQGSLYRSRLIRLRLWRDQMVQSMSRRGNCRDNAPTKRLFRSLKSERIPPLGYDSIVKARGPAAGSELCSVSRELLN